MPEWSNGLVSKTSVPQGTVGSNPILSVLMIFIFFNIMKTSLPPLDLAYFKKFNTSPVEIKAYNPVSKEIAQEYIELLITLLKDFEVKIIHRGSTAFKISGKGDIEIGVYPGEEDWDMIVEKLESYFGSPENTEVDYARFNTLKNGFEIEIILQKGESARVDIALTEYLMSHPKLLKRYENLKRSYSFSKREYQIQKDRFLRNIIDSIPD